METAEVISQKSWLAWTHILNENGMLLLFSYQSPKANTILYMYLPWYFWSLKILHETYNLSFSLIIFVFFRGNSFQGLPHTSMVWFLRSLVGCHRLLHSPNLVAVRQSVGLWSTAFIKVRFEYILSSNNCHENTTNTHVSAYLAVQIWGTQI